MELWNDFEGKIVDGRFPLDRLIGPQGRSALFATKDEAGGPAVIRVIESLNDEDEILARWRKVGALKQESLIGMRATGRTVLDGTHLVYAVMEPWDAELSDVLRERALTVDEAKQVGLSVVDALKALHGAGLVHEHVEPSNVWARGEAVKLRSDVAREIPEEADAERLRKADVRDFSLLMLQCLTQQRQMDALRAARLPGSIEEVIRRGENGEWGLEEIGSVLRPIPPAAKPAAPAAVPVSTGAAAGTGTGVSAAPAGRQAPAVAAAAAGAGAAAAAAARSSAAASGGAAAGGETDSGAFMPRSVKERLRESQSPGRVALGTEDEKKRWGLLAGIAAGVLLLVLLGIHFLRGSRASGTKTVVQDTPSAVTVPEQSSDNRPPARDERSASQPVAEKPSPVADAGARSAASLASSQPTGEAQWRVVAYTYNREEQAQSKATAIAQRHPGLKPEVFSPSGRSPYLVALGGWMTASEASSMRARAKGQGMPRDTYMRNYKPRR